MSERTLIGTWRGPTIAEMAATSPGPLTAKGKPEANGAAPAPQEVMDAHTAGDGSVSRAFTIGWRLAELRRCASLADTRERARVSTMPGLDGLSPRDRAKLRIDELAAMLHKLLVYFHSSGVEPPGVTKVRQAAVSGSLRQLRAGIDEAHVEIVCALTAADGRLGKAYRLGRELYETCFGPECQDSFDHAFGPRLIAVKDWLSDLSSTFPPHSSRAVAISLRTWEAWAAAPAIDGEKLEWATHGAAVRDSLRDQGRRWRALLSGDKEGRDMLETGDYVHAAQQMVGQATGTTYRFIARLKMPLTVIMALVLGGVALVVFADNDKLMRLGAALTTIGGIGGLGAGVRARLGRAAQQLEAGLWGAELDAAVAQAITIGPPGWGERVADHRVHPAGDLARAGINIETLKRFRAAADGGVRTAKRRERRLFKLLAPDVEINLSSSEKLSGRSVVASWLADADERERIAAEPVCVLTGREPGFLVTYLKSGEADVWRVREGLIRRWEPFESRGEARVAAGLSRAP
jgi:hypothetical protein